MATYYATGIEYRCNLILADAFESAGSLGGPGDSCQAPMILAAVGFECFLNEMAYTLENSISKLDPPIQDLGISLRRLEAKRKPALDKATAVFEALTRRALPKGAGPYPDLKLLFDLRDALVHSKPATFDMKVASNGAHFSLVSAFRSRKLVSPEDEKISFVWTRHILTPAVARWACNVAADRAAWLAELLPKQIGERKLLLGLVTRFPLFAADGCAK